MILSKEQYDQMIDDDPFPWYKYSRLSEEEKTLSYLSMNGSEHENLTVAIANFGPQQFRGTYGTNFQPPGFERSVCQYNFCANNNRSGPVPPPGLLPPSTHYHGSYFPGVLYRPGIYPPGLALQTVSLLGPSLPSKCFLGAPGLNPIWSKDNPQLYDALMQSSQLVSHDHCEGAVDLGNVKAPLIESMSWESPAFGPLVVGGDLSDDDCEKASHSKKPSQRPSTSGPLMVEHDSDSECDRTVNPECEETPVLQRRTWVVPTSGPLVVGRDSSDGEDNDYAYHGGNEIGRPKQSGLDRKRSISSVASNETIDITSGHVSLTSSRTTPTKASCG